MLVLTGSYDTEIGIVVSGVDGWYYPTIASVRLVPGSVYEMWDEVAWHSVRPTKPSLTLMVIGPPFDTPHPSIKDQPEPGKLGPLTERQHDDMINDMWRLISRRPVAAVSE